MLKPNQKYWIGSKIKKNGKKVWVDKSPITYRNFKNKFDTKKKN